MTPTVERNVARSRYELMIDGVVQGVVLFRPVAPLHPGEATILHISHAEVVPELRGQGFSEPMVRAVLDDVRAHNELVVSTCGYVSSVIDRHPEYADLIDD